MNVNLSAGNDEVNTPNLNIVTRFFTRRNFMGLTMISHLMLLQRAIRSHSTGVRWPLVCTGQA